MEDQSKRKATIVHRVRPSASRPVAVQSQAKAKTRVRAQKPVETPSNLLLKLQTTLLDAVAQRSDRSQAIDCVCNVLRDQLADASILHLGRKKSVDGQQSELGLQISLADEMFERLPPSSAETVLQAANKACETGMANVETITGAHDWALVTTPVIRRGQAPETITAALRFSPETNLAHTLSVLQLAASHLTLWEVMDETRREQKVSKNSAACLDLMTQVCDARDWTTATYVLVNELQSYLDCDQVAVGMIQGKQQECRLAAVSGVSEFDKRSEFTNQIEAVMNESVLLDRITAVSSDTTQTPDGTLAHEDLRRASQSDQILSVPLLGTDGEVVAVCLLSFKGTTSDRKLEDAVSFLQTSQLAIGSRLAKAHNDQVSMLARPFHAIARASRSRKVIGGLMTLALFAGAMCVPMDYRVGCDCQLEPVSRRFVAAPYDGTLEESLVEAGEMVQAGQVLARMDARELRWELSGYKADFESEKKKRNAAYARDEVALAQQSDLEMQRLSLKMQLLRHRLENLEIKSPVEGVVIAGDLKKAEGVPLTIGQTLFEIGPLDAMVVEVSVPESDILHVAEGMAVEIRLDADQSMLKTGTVRRLTPRSETRDHQNIYIAEVELNDQDTSLRPGMKGTAKIITEPHAIGWNLFHKAYEKFAMHTGI